MVSKKKEKALDSAQFNRNGIIPIYYQIHEAMLEWIAEGIYKPHDRLPSENELCAKFNVSRNTAQRALRTLVDKGAAYREQGRGTFVTDKQITYSITAKLSFSAEIIGHAKDVRSILKFSKIQKASIHIARVLEIVENDLVITIQRIRLVDKVPTALMTSYLPHDLVPGLLDTLVEESSLFQAIKTVSGLEVSGGYETLQTIHADAYEAEMLGIEAGDAVFLLERVIKANNGRVIELVKTVLRGDISKFYVELT